MASSNFNNEWLQIYQNNLNTGTPQPPEVTSSASSHLGSGGPRRRPRASRRTPTTLLNTDTTNFRAMVHHFTGVGGAGSTSAPTDTNSSDFNRRYHGGGGYGNLEVFRQAPPQQQRYNDTLMAAENGGVAGGQNIQHGFFLQEGLKKLGSEHFY